MDKSYFEKVYEQTHRALLRYAIVHLDDPTDAEDAVQETMLRAWQHRSRFQGESSVRTALKSIFDFQSSHFLSLHLPLI